MLMETTTLSQLDKLKKQKEALEAKIQKAESLHKQKEKKEDTRRKILLGAYFLDKFRNEGTLDSIKKELDSFLSRNSDRKLFGLPDLKTEATTS